MRRHTGHRRRPSESRSAKEESIRSPQMSQTLPPTGRIPARQSGQTGRRDRFSWGSPQMRQSDGNKTEKRLSATRLTQGRSAEVGLTQTRSGPNESFRETIECPATAALAWLARIRSSLLLKTASFVTPRTPTRRGQSLLQCLQYSGDDRR